MAMVKEKAAAIPPCGQCGKPSVVQIEGQGLCVDCWYKFEVTRTLVLRNSAIGMNHALDEMDEITGLPRGARMRVPDIPKGPVILNNFKIDNSVVGAINTGNVQTIDVSLTYLHAAGNDKARDAFKVLTNAIINDKSLSALQKNELMEQVAFLSEQSVAAVKDRKLGLVKAALANLTQAAGAVSAISGAWQAAEPIVKGIFNLT